MINQYIKRQLYRLLERPLPLYGNSSSKKIGLDCHRMFGDDMEEIKKLIKEKKDKHKTPKQKIPYYQKKIEEKEEYLFNNFFKKIKKIAYLFDRQQIYAVFDGQKHILPINRQKQISRIGQSKQFWVKYNTIRYTIMFILQILGIHVIRAPYEADFQLIKMYFQGKIDYILSYDLSFVDFGVPLIQEIDDKNMGKVIDFTQIDPQTIENNILKGWVIATKEIIPERQKSVALMKRIYFGLLSGKKHINILTQISLLEKMRLLLQWDEKKEDFLEFLTRKKKIKLTQQQRRLFYEAKFYFHLATVYSYQNCMLEALINELKEVLEQGNREENEQIVGRYKQYSPDIQIQSSDYANNRRQVC